MSSPTSTPRQHGVKGVYYAGDWLDIEDCPGTFTEIEDLCSGGGNRQNCVSSCPRSQSRNFNNTNNTTYDIVIIGAGCIGAAIARELSKYQFKNRVLWVEAADDVSQGATKGNSGIVHAGYDDKPNSQRAKYCWTGNQMFAELDRELRFGYQRNGSLVLAFTKREREHLYDLLERGKKNGVKNLRVITNTQELLELEPHLHPDAIGALYSPDAGNVIPYEYTIALAENAVDNGVELLIRREVVNITQEDNEGEDGLFTVTLRHWEPQEYIQTTATTNKNKMSLVHILSLIAVVLWSAVVTFMGLQLVLDTDRVEETTRQLAAMLTFVVVVVTHMWVWSKLKGNTTIATTTDMVKLVQMAGTPQGKATTSNNNNNNKRVQVDDMLVGGSGASRIVNGTTVNMETVKAKYIVNCAGGASDKIARMIGDDSFTIKPRLGDYLLLNRNQGHLARHTLFPCPDPVLGKGVLVQTTLWGNLILGPTARDTYKPEARDMSDASVQEYILSKCKKLVPSFDPKETFHAFCGARAKSDRGDWIIEASKQNSSFINVAGIDSPGLAGSPAIALEVLRLLQKAGLETTKNPSFNPNRAPIITPKQGMRGLKMGPVGKNDSDGSDEKRMASNVICKCEKVTELEVVRAMRRSLPIDSSQAIRKRTRAGMGHCQGDPDNYACEARVRAIIARENGAPIQQIGGRPWPATSTLSRRWIDEKEKEELQERMNSE